MRPTNVLFIFSDQHSRRVLGCYGNAAARTPVLDALAARGTRFASAYCQTPICVPSRASLATGRFAHAVDSWDNATPYVGTEAPSWGHRLTARGHQVTTIGKLHYRDAVDDPSGFPDQRLPMHVLDGVGDLYGLLRGDMPAAPEPGPGPGGRAGETEYTRYDRAIADGAERWLHEEAPVRTNSALVPLRVVRHAPLPPGVPQQYWDLYPPDALPLPGPARAPELVAPPRPRAEAPAAGHRRPFAERTVRTAHARLLRHGHVPGRADRPGAGRPRRRRGSRTPASSTHRPRRDAGRARPLVEERHVRGARSRFRSSWPGRTCPPGRSSGPTRCSSTSSPSILEAVGRGPAPEDRTLPGRSLWALAREAASHGPRSASTTRSSRRAGSSWSGLPATSTSTTLATRPSSSTWPSTPRRRATWRPTGPTPTGGPRARARAPGDLRPGGGGPARPGDQRRRLDAAGGDAAVLAGGVKIPYTPAPDQFDPAPVEARERTI